MATVIDTNVIAALWNLDDALNAAARSALDAALARGPLIVPAPVYAELMDERVAGMFGAPDAGKARDKECGHYRIERPALAYVSDESAEHVRESGAD